MRLFTLSLFATLCLLALPAAIADEAGALPSVRCELEASSFRPGSLVKVTLLVEYEDGGTPIPWILQEAFPSDGSITTAAWNGKYYAPILRDGKACWIFGYPGESWTPEAGTLVYYLQTPSTLPEGETTQNWRLQGEYCTWSDSGTVSGDRVFLLDPDAPASQFSAHQVTLHPGWNLLSLPQTLQTDEAERLTDERTVYLWRKPASGKSTPHDSLYCQGEIPETPGEPFWIHHPGNDSVELTLKTLDGAPSTLVTPAKSLDAGWNLVGVSGSQDCTLDDNAEVWRWKDGVFTLAPENTLAPGEAAWLNLH